MKKLIWCAALVLSPSAASEARTWPDAGGWSIGESDDFCLMFQEYEGKGETNLSIAITIDGPAMARITNLGWSAQEGQEYEVTWQLIGAKSFSGPARGTGERYDARKGFSSLFPSEFVDSFAKATSLRVMMGDVLVDRLSLAGTAAAVAMTRKCVAHIKSLRAAERREKERFAHIPDDPFQQSRRDENIKKYGTNAMVPLGSPASWITSDDYPSRALRENRGGTVGFSVTVSAAGLVTSCIVTSSSGSDDLDTAACNVMRTKARFEPSALGGQYDSKITWRAPS